MNEKELIEYADICGYGAAADLLLLCGPDGYAGDYDAMMEALRGGAEDEDV